MAGNVIQFKLSNMAWSLLGLDDDAVVAQVYPSLRWVRGTEYKATDSDARAILDSLADRAGIDSGYEHDAGERRALRTAAVKLRVAIRLAALAGLSKPRLSSGPRR